MSVRFITGFFSIGLLVFSFAPEHHLKLHVFGLVAAIIGLINGAVAKLWGQMIFNSLALLYDSRFRAESEMRRSEAADL
jgi:hypothetical protein